MDLLYVVTAESCVEAASENHSTVGVDFNNGVNTLPLYIGKEDSVCDKTTRFLSLFERLVNWRLFSILTMMEQVQEAVL